MKTITVYGKVTILSGGKKGTSFRDKNGNYHAAFFNASIGGRCGSAIELNGKALPVIDEETVRALGLKADEFYSFRWNVSASDAEEFANLPMGTVLKVVLEPRMTKDVAGNDVVKCYKRPDSESITFDCRFLDYDVVKEGRHERHRFTQYIADVQDDEGTETADADEKEDLEQ